MTLPINEIKESEAVMNEREILEQSIADHQKAIDWEVEQRGW